MRKKVKCDTKQFLTEIEFNNAMGILIDFDRIITADCRKFSPLTSSNPLECAKHLGYVVFTLSYVRVLILKPNYFRFCSEYCR